jgi:hypothetical protein
VIQIPTPNAPPPGVTIQPASPEPSATFTNTAEPDTPTSTATATDTETPTETATLLPTETFTPLSTSTPIPTVIAPTAPPKPPDQTQSENLIFPDVQGCSERWDIDGRLYAHAFVEKPVANSGDKMLVGFYVNGALTTQTLAVQQILTLGPFVDGDTVGDQSDAWQCVKPPPSANSNTSLCTPDGTCNCSWIPMIQIKQNGFVRNILHRYVCFDSCGNANPPFCSGSATCSLKNIRN